MSLLALYPTKEVTETGVQADSLVASTKVIWHPWIRLVVMANFYGLG